MKIEKLFTLAVLVCCFIALISFSGCATQNYIVNCYNKNAELVYREHKNWLIHFHDTTKFHTCETIRTIDGKRF